MGPLFKNGKSKETAKSKVQRLYGARLTDLVEWVFTDVHMKKKKKREDEQRRVNCLPRRDEAHQTASPCPPSVTWP
jgi:hypothetical protein